MPPLLKAVATGAAAFVATNIDDIFVLTLFFGQVGRRGLRRWHVVAGQYLGIAALVALSLVGYFARFVVPRAWIGLLGLLPILIGVKKLFERGAAEEVLESSPLKPAAASSVLTVAAVTFANGGDNISIYTPLFAASGATELVVLLCVFFVLVAVWCVAAYHLGGRPAVVGVLNRYGHLIVPFVLIGLGIYIMAESDTFGLFSFQGE